MWNVKKAKLIEIGSRMVVPRAGDKEVGRCSSKGTNFYS